LIRIIGVRLLLEIIVLEFVDVDENFRGAGLPASGLMAMPYYFKLLS